MLQKSQGHEGQRPYSGLTENQMTQQPNAEHVPGLHPSVTKDIPGTASET